MGSTISLGKVGKQLACCCRQAVCSLFVCCPSCGNSPTTNVIHGLIILITVILSCLNLDPRLQSILKPVPLYDDDRSGNITGDLTTDLTVVSNGCKYAFDHLALYRNSFDIAVFILLVSFIVTSVIDHRNEHVYSQNGFWGLKYVIVFSGIVGSFFITPGSFSQFSLICGLMGCIIYFVHQFVELIYIAYSYSDKRDHANDTMWNLVWFFTSVGYYMTVITGVIMMYYGFTQT